MYDKVFATIVGAGVVGCAVAYELSQDLNQDILVIEKNPQINGENQSSRNSGVVHSGIYYPREFGPLKSKLCIEGNKLIYKFCMENNVSCTRTGKLVVATCELEEEYLDDVLRIAGENGISGLKILTGEKIKNFEPNVMGTKAIYVPDSGIVEPTEFINSLCRLSEYNGVIFLTANEVVGIKPEDKGFLLKIQSRSQSETFKTRILINSAGLYSDAIARMVNPGFRYKMDPVKGEYAKFYRSRRSDIFLNGKNIYPVPFGYLPDGERLNVSFKEFSKLFKDNRVNKSVGVHLTPTFDITGGNCELGDMVSVGPAYSKPENNSDYVAVRDLEYFYLMVKPFFSNLKLDDISPHQVGIRAKLKNYYDFIIERDKKFPGCINLVGIDSPGLTSSLAIAKYVKNIIGKIK